MGGDCDFAELNAVTADINSPRPILSRLSLIDPESLKDIQALVSEILVPRWP